MREGRCSACTELYPEDELLLREDTGEPVCPACSGLLVDEDLDCAYDEVG